ncbi:hypothetical protein [Consotaella salsifontis]|uniref:Uncharacterized protein n=1 Tax=Consotaella salsifontis TaxID=1365950 RepID=A0A1T4NPN4_9HYPH|nr:hypothetical protein [Consotaella salsifontis]SJZ81149.1 hypothetical protein SAMN05428963_103121 [Consotaella salsifontis]
MSTIEPREPGERTVIVNNDRGVDPGPAAPRSGGGGGWFLAGILVVVLVVGFFIVGGGSLTGNGGSVAVKMPNVDVDVAKN